MDIQKRLDQLEFVHRTADVASWVWDIAGDSVQFDTNTRTGRLIGNVKMVITDQSRLKGPGNE